LFINSFDFNHDGNISREDVRVIMSYCPFTFKSSEETKKQEGLYSQSRASPDFRMRIA